MGAARAEAAVAASGEAVKAVVESATVALAEEVRVVTAPVALEVGRTAAVPVA